MDKYKNKILDIISDKRIGQSVRFNTKTIERLNRCVKHINRNGLIITRTKAITIAVNLYLDFIKNEND